MTAFRDTVAIFDREAEKDFVRAVNRMEALGRRTAPHDTGQLANSLQAKVIRRGKKEYVAEYFSLKPYARYLEEGTGLFGPYNKLIRPKAAKALRWIGENGPVFSAYSSGSGKHKEWFTKLTNRWGEMFR